MSGCLQFVAWTVVFVVVNTVGVRVFGSGFTPGSLYGFAACALSWRRP